MYLSFPCRNTEFSGFVGFKYCSAIRSIFIVVISLSSAIASSISQLWLMSVPKDRKGALTGVLCPLLRFLNRDGKLRFPLISNYVSSRFRRVLQLTQEADMENKTLEEKLAELELCANSANDLSELRRVLDAQQQCFECYLKHKNGVEHPGTAADCNCICHEILLKMLIFVDGENTGRVCFKLIDHNLFNEALAMKRFEKPEQEGEEDDGWNFVLRRVDTPDHYIEVDGVITNIAISVDKKQLFVSYETRAFATSTKYSVYCVDLEKMVLDKFPFSGAMLSNEQAFLCSNEFLLASAVGEEVHIWARRHGGNAVQRLAVDTRIVDLSLHPTNNTLITASQNYLAVWSTTQPN
ncbi:hypothetical protein Y032_0015g2759 [Ancylostoma ceylanicum]|uniref:Uncharacterized protein n=2 Tax=Ancylostoma ceylanicum TaxID=53326 RepID=A0A016V7M3_9BILA|nr:hypothetical protein Y032_0015g2759 [Ancylostoma ceylanicum]